jgi:hypothetical protein
MVDIAGDHRYLAGDSLSSARHFWITFSINLVRWPRGILWRKASMDSRLKRNWK